MRFLVFSDAHGTTYNLMCAIETHPESDGVIFLGDGASDVRAMEKFINRPLYIVKGNCDFSSKEKAVDIIDADNHRILISHGHLFNVKSELYTLKYTARDNGCDIALFGHTHIPFCNYDDGLYLMNPGTISMSHTPTYGILDITAGGIATNIVKVH